MPENLTTLTERARRELHMTAFPHRSWVLRDSARHTDGGVDVLIVGAGQCGLAAGLGLTQIGIDNIALVDAKPAGLQGPWATYAKMKTLRSNVAHPGPALGVAALYYESWHRAKFGNASWESLQRIPVENWPDYLQWFKETVNLPVRYDTTVTDITPTTDEYIVTTLDGGGKAATIHARMVILATGIEGVGPWRVPAPIADHVDRAHYSVVGDPIDYAAFGGKSLAVIGGGASAYDHAATAAEHGAARVDILFRRTSLHRINPHHWTEFHGFLANFAALPHDQRLAVMKTIIPANEPPPTATFERATCWDSVNVLLGETLDFVEDVGDRVLIDTRVGRVRYDHVMVATGVHFDPSIRPELASLNSHIASWRDVIGAHQDPQVDGLLDAPYLGPDMQFSGVDLASDSLVKRVYNLTGTAMLSHGPSGTSINGLRQAAERITRSISRHLFLDTAADYVAEIASFDTHELTSPWPAASLQYRRAPLPTATT